MGSINHPAMVQIPVSREMVVRSIVFSGQLPGKGGVFGWEGGLEFCTSKAGLFPQDSKQVVGDKKNKQISDQGRRCAAAEGGVKIRIKIKMNMKRACGLEARESG